LQDVHYHLLRVVEFRESRHCENHTLLRGFNEFLPVFFIYIFRLCIKFYARTLKILLGTCDFGENRHEEGHTSVTRVNEIKLHVYRETSG